MPKPTRAGRRAPTRPVVVPPAVAAARQRAERSTRQDRPGGKVPPVRQITFHGRSRAR